MEGLNKNIDPDFERQKKDIEWKNKSEIKEHLASKFSELIAENPIVVYYSQVNEDTGTENIRASFNKVKEVRIDESGTGGSMQLIFNYDDWVAVGKEGCRGSNYFDKSSNYYKISKDSADNIISMMNELIKRSGYNEQEKTKMLEDVVNNFKNKITNVEEK